MSRLSNLWAFGWTAALCIVLSYPVHAETGDLFDGTFDAQPVAKTTNGGLGNFFHIQTVPGGRSNIGSPTIAADVSVIKDFSYGSLPDQKMDIYTQGHPAGAPVIFMVHGGGWRNGGKDVSKTVNNKVARWVPEGFVFISINYPMIPDADVAQQAKNVETALAAAQKHAAEWGGNPAKFILMGHSAGAHLVSLINANPEPAYALGAQPWLGVVSLDSGAMNVVQLMSARHMKLYDNAFGSDPEQWKRLSPFYQMTSKALPWMNVCSTKRDTSCSQSKAMSDKAATLGVKAALHQEDLTHGEINGNLGLPGGYTAAVESFMATLDPAVAELLAHPPAAQPAESSGREGLLQRWRWRERRAARQQDNP